MVYNFFMDHIDRDWAAELIDDQVDFEKDEELGSVYAEKGISNKQREGYQKRVKKIVGGVVVNVKKPDSGTRATESKLHEYKRDDAKFEAENKKKRYNAALIEEMKWEGEEKSEEQEDESDQLEYLSEREGLEEFNFLKKNGVVSIDDETEFSDGRRSDGSYRDGYWTEPTPEDIKEIEAEEKWQAREARKNRNFRENQTYGGKRGGSQNVRKI